jgi:hypothetical protein
MTVVNTGANQIANHIAATYRVVAVGNGGDTTSVQSTGLNSFVRMKVGQIPDVVGTSLIYNVSFTGAEIPSSGISELGIFKTGTGESNGTTPPNGILLSRVTFTNTGVVGASDVVSFQVRIEVGN